MKVLLWTQNGTIVYPKVSESGLALGKPGLNFRWTSFLLSNAKRGFIVSGGYQMKFGRFIWVLLWVCHLNELKFHAALILIFMVFLPFSPQLIKNIFKIKIETCCSIFKMPCLGIWLLILRHWTLGKGSDINSVFWKDNSSGCIKDGLERGILRARWPVRSLFSCWSWKIMKNLNSAFW